MHNRALHDTLAAFVEEAAWQLAEEVSGGAEVPFEVIEQGRASAPLYCYRPLTQRFIAERAGALGRLPTFPAAIQGLMTLPDLPGYLAARGRRPSGPDARSQADAALQAFVCAMWAEATDFSYDAQRFGGGVRGAGGGRVRRLRAVRGRHAGGRARHRVRRGGARRRARARARHEPARCAARAARRRVRHRRGALARGHAGRHRPRPGRAPPAPPADRAAAVGRRRAGARTDRVGAHGRRPVAGHPARHRPATRRRATAW